MLRWLSFSVNITNGTGVRHEHSDQPEQDVVGPVLALAHGQDQATSASRRGLVCAVRLDRGKKTLVVPVSGITAHLHAHNPTDYVRIITPEGDRSKWGTS